MDELIKITDQDGRQAVSARELHAFLESKKDFSSWIKDRVKKYELIENIDYAVFTKLGENPTGGRPAIEYALTLYCAKELSMVEGNAKGKQARRYFIACEEKLKEVVSKPLTQLEILQQSVNILAEQDKRLVAVEEKMKIMEAKTKTRPDYFTIAGYGTLKGIKVNLQLASSLGRMASRICKEQGFPTDEVPDPRFGKVKSYPEEILKVVFNMNIV